MTPSHCETEQNSTPPTAVPSTADAVGVPALRWYIAVVNHCGEIRAMEGLAKDGFEAYVASQRVPRLRKTGPLLFRDKIILPAKVFVKCTERQRRSIVHLPYIFRFMTDRAGRRTDTGVSPLAVVSQKEIDKLKFMLGQSDIPVEIVADTYASGDRVRVVRGPLKGLEGDVVKAEEGKSELIVSLDTLGYARMIIQTRDLKKL